jgi:hypothetical protein
VTEPYTITQECLRRGAAGDAGDACRVQRVQRILAVAGLLDLPDPDPGPQAGVT